ncbi:MAG: PEPxxWA-CTERM sorting domain-containing protein [Sphingomicrobium sp.]
MFMNAKVVVIGLAVAFSTAASAQIAVFERTTSDLSTYNRPIEDVSGLSAVGTAVRYDLVSFSVSTNGTYTVAGAGVFDTFAGLYQTSFNPAAPLTNALVYNDDLTGLRTSGYDYNLVAGTQYFALMTGFANTDSGAYAASISGPGSVTPIASTADSPSIITQTGDTTAGSVFNRPLQDGSALSAVGTATRYDVINFTVDTNGEYSFIIAAMFDPFFGLYANNFDPNAPLANDLIYNDDLLGFTTSGFSTALTAGTQYYAVVTGFANSDFGAYALTGAGPGAINLVNAGVPEPSTWAMMLIGFVGIGYSMRRRRRIGARSQLSA